jgi:hypothetical protein
VKLQAELGGDASYWLTLFAAADALKDCDLMLHAARQAHAILPTNPSVVNNYAAALLILRQNPDEAVRLTLQLFTQNPASLATKINHSAALLLNERASEAEVILKTVKTNSLNRAQLTVYHFDLFKLTTGWAGSTARPRLGKSKRSSFIAAAGLAGQVRRALPGDAERQARHRVAHRYGNCHGACHRIA